MRLRQWGQALFCLLFVSGLAARAEAAGLDYPFPFTASRT